MATTVMADPEFGSVVFDNETDVPLRDVMHHPEVAALVRWASTAQGIGRGGPSSRAGGLFHRDAYVTPEKIYEQIQLAEYAIENDDVVSGVVDITESLAFSKVSFYCEDEAQEDLWNQIAADVDLDARLREMWRGLFGASQFYVGMWWGHRSYRVRGRTESGNPRRKEFRDLRVPTALTMLDPLRVIPVGMGLFNQESLAYAAEREEAEKLDGLLLDPVADPLVGQLILSRYEPNRSEARRIQDAGFPIHDLFLLNPLAAWRHTATRPQYNMWASVRMKTIFELLDMKNQLRQMDRAHLIGGTNFIVLITKGTDELPAQPAEIANLQGQVRTVARVPVLVGDHRLKVEIVTPKLDTTLGAERYGTLDDRITARLFQMFLATSQRNKDDPEPFMKVVARGMESRRHMLRRTFEAKFIRPVMEANPELDTRPKLRFHPAQIALAFDSNFASFLLDLRESKEISRETILTQFDMDQDDEAAMREREAERYDDIFQTAVPFDSPDNAADPDEVPAKPGEDDEGRAVERRGGRRRGGAAPGSGQGRAPRRIRKKSD